MKKFLFDSHHGPFRCEFDQCKEESRIALLRDDEDQRITGLSSQQATTFVIEHNLGRVLCDKHFDDYLRTKESPKYAEHDDHNHEGKDK